jgi:hypothetical protein
MAQMEFHSFGQHEALGVLVFQFGVGLPLVDDFVIGEGLRSFLVRAVRVLFQTAVNPFK